MRRVALIVVVFMSHFFAQSPTSFRYFYDDANELYRVLDSTGTLIEYTYDPSGNITNVARTTVPATQLSILNVTPSNAIGGATITILGQNFSAIAAGDTVMIGGVAATVLSATATQLVVLVPPGTHGGTISVTVGGVTTTWSNTIAVAQPPFITSISPASGKNGTTVTVSIVGQDLLGATFALTSVDPVNANGGTVTVVSNTGTLATLTLVLGATEGQFALIGTNTIGVGAVTPGSTFIIGPINNAIGFYTSVLNISDNTTTNPPFPVGTNAISSYVSVLNTGLNPTTSPPLPKGQNNVSTYISVLNTTDNTTTNPPFPASTNAVSSYVSVLNTGLNPTTSPPLPAGQNDVISYLSVLNTYFGSTSSFVHFAASLGVAVCNTSNGCAAIAPKSISSSASPSSTRERTLMPSPALPSAPKGSLPVLDPLDASTSVIVGQSIRLTARNVDPGSTVEFDVNQTAVAIVNAAPYETLFTVPDGVGELVFQLVVRAASHPERLSQLTRMTVAPDAGTNISGNVVQATGAVELALAAGGLRAEFFHVAQPVTSLPVFDALQPVRSDYVTAINEPNPASVFGDDPLGARLSSDYAIRFSGEVRADVAGQYQFWLAARSGAALIVDGHPLADSGFVTGQPVEAAVSVALDRGWHRLEVIYYQAVGASSLRLEWQQPDASRREVLGPQYLRTVLGMNAISQADGTFAFEQVPKKFDTVWVRVKQGDTYIEYPAVQPGAAQVHIPVQK